MARPPEKLCRVRANRKKAKRISPSKKMVNGSQEQEKRENQEKAVRNSKGKEHHIL